MTRRPIDAEPSAPNTRDNDSNTLTLLVGGAVMAFIIGAPIAEAAVDHFKDSDHEMACPTVVNTHDMPECK